MAVKKMPPQQGAGRWMRLFFLLPIRVFYGTGYFGPTHKFSNLKEAFLYQDMLEPGKRISCYRGFHFGVLYIIDVCYPHNSQEGPK